MKYIYITLVLLTLQGCGGSSDNSIPQETATVSIAMELNKSYTVYTGDKLSKTSENTQVSIVKNTQDETSTLTLLKGSANILRK